VVTRRAPRGGAACVAAALVLVPLVGACGDGGARQQVVVFAASSLSDVFTQIALEYERDHAGVDVVLDFAGSSALVAQIADGAPADVLATADDATMRQAVSGGSVAGSPTTFATNSLVIAVEPGNPLGITGLADLAAAPVVVLAAPEVPAGAYARDVLARAGVVVDVASYEQNVRSVLSKVALGEADAGIVYRTDAIATDAVAAVPIPTAQNVEARYPIVAIVDDPSASSFVDFVLGANGRRLLADAGFGLP
jgi:molybdate transport system substrate-binding protein